MFRPGLTASASPAPWAMRFGSQRASTFRYPYGPPSTRHVKIYQDIRTRRRQVAIKALLKNRSLKWVLHSISITWHWHTQTANLMQIPPCSDFNLDRWPFLLWGLDVSTSYKKDRNFYQFISIQHRTSQGKTLWKHFNHCSILLSNIKFEHIAWMSFSWNVPSYHIQGIRAAWNRHALKCSSLLIIYTS